MSDATGFSKESSATVNVGIATRNRADVLPKAIASALSQTGVQVTVSVLDDGSTDSTPLLRNTVPVQWSRHETSRGIIESRNRLMAESSAEFYASLDDDAWFLAGDELALAVQRMRDQPLTAAIAFDILSPDRPDPEPRADAQRVPVFIGCGHVLRLAAVRAAGFYAASPGTYGAEEKDLAYRLADLGFSVERLPGVHVWHDKAWTDRNWYPLHRSGVCNELVMTVRRCPMPDLIAVLPFKIARFMLYWARKPRFLAAGVAGVGLFIRHLHSTWATRGPLRRKTFWSVTRGRFT